MAAPTKQERQFDALLEANARLTEQLVTLATEVIRSRPQQAVYTPSADTPQVPAVPSFEDLPEDDWDKPERLWLREEEEDEQHMSGMTGDVDPQFLNAVLQEAGLLNPTTT